MKPSSILLVVFVVAIGPAAKAQDYPWCSNFHDGAGVNCGFTSREQCEATARGTGGFCSEDNTYARARPEPRGATKRHRPRKRR